MRVANGSQHFRRDTEGSLGRAGDFRSSEGRRESGLPHEIEPLVDRLHDHPEELSMHRKLVRRCAFPFVRRIPRITKRRTAQLLAMVWLCWIIAACTEWRAQHDLKTLRKQLVAFLQETTFYVVEEGKLSDGWQSPLQRRLHDGQPVDRAHEGLELDSVGELRKGAPDTDVDYTPDRSSAAADDGRGASPGVTQPLEERGMEGRFSLANFAERADGESDEFVGGLRPTGRSGNPEDGWGRERAIRSQGITESHDSCPLVYTVDAKVAKKHGLLLFQEELELLGTVTARLCRCLCHFPAHAQEGYQAPPRRRTGVTATNNGQAEEDPQDNAGAGGPRRRLGVCQGEAHALMLEEMLKGANVVISGDSGWFYRWFASMQDAYRRTCSHFSTRSTLGIPEGTVLRTVLTGTDMYEDSWFQLEGAAWRPFRHPIDAVRHGFNFMQYKLRQSQVGPLGKSAHTDLHPMMVTFDGCVSTNDAPGTEGAAHQHRGGRLLIVPKDDA